MSTICDADLQTTLAEDTFTETSIHRSYAKYVKCRDNNLDLVHLDTER